MEPNKSILGILEEISFVDTMAEFEEIMGMRDFNKIAEQLYVPGSSGTFIQIKPLMASHPIPCIQWSTNSTTSLPRTV